MRGETVVRIAITRDVSPAIGRCELTHVARQPIDAAIAAEQHRVYEQCLEDLGCRLVRLPAAPDLPDSVFVEDTAVVLEEVAVLSRPGAESRRGEVDAVGAALARFRPLRAIEAPGTLDGGDVLRLDRTLLVGISTRTNAEGVAQLAALVEPFGYRVGSLRPAGCLHLKSAVTALGPGLVLANPRWVHAGALGGAEVVEVDPSEPFAANALRVGDTVILPAACPRTADRLRARGMTVRTVDVSELAKAEGGVTCCSIVFDVPGVEGSVGPSGAE